MKKKVSKILLINTPRLTLKQLNEYSERSKYYWEVYPPLGFMYISAAVKNEIDYSEIKVLDLHIESIKKSQKNQKVDWLEMTEDCMKSFQPDMVAISVMFGASFESAQLVGKFLRKKYPDLVIASGGVG